MRFIRRLAYWLRFRARQDELRDEITFHRDLVAADLERRGSAPDDARNAARRVLGNDTVAREAARAVWLAPWLDALQQDWRYAWRGLRRSRAFTLVAVTSLALGIGANTAIFGLLYGLLLARLPVPSAEHLVQLRRDLGTKGFDERFSRAEVAALGSGQMPISTFASTLASIEIDGVASTISTDAVDGRYFELLELRPERGRLIVAGDDQAGAPVVVVTDRFWRGRLNADPTVVGRTIKLAGQTFTIVGVTPPGFAGIRFPAIAEAFVPFRAATTFGIYRGDDRSQIVTAFGLRPETLSPAAIQRRLTPMWNRCCADGSLVTPQRGAPASRAALVLADVSRGIPQVKLDLRGQYERVLLALMAGVGVLLLAACANVANLLLARSAARAGELAMRLALGASRARLVTQLVIESLQLSFLGAVTGVVLAYWGTSLLTRERIGDLSSVVDPHLGPIVLAFTALVSIVSGIVFGVVPAVRVMRVDLATPLKQAARRGSMGKRGLFDRGLVALQVALAVLLVSGATLLVQTLRNLRDTDLGFDPTQRFLVDVETRRTAYQRQGMTRRMVDEMLQRARGIPGVRSAAFASLLPAFGGRTTFDDVTVRGGEPPADGDPATLFVGVTPRYFETLGIPLRAGRDVGPPAATGSLGSTREVVVNDLFVRKFFPGRDPIGQEFNDGTSGDSVRQADRIVGVVGSSRFVGPRAPAKPMFFVPIEDGDWPYLMLVVHAGNDGASIGTSVARVVAEVAPGIGRGDPVSLASSIDETLARERVSAGLAMLFGVIALSLVAVGLYGVMLYHVTERTTEIGIRVALGATAPAVVGLVIRQSLSIVAVGLAVGLPMATLAGHAVSSQLYGVEPSSVLALGTAAVGIIVIALAASLIPARRAVGVDPLTALRES